MVEGWISFSAGRRSATEPTSRRMRRAVSAPVVAWGNLSSTVLTRPSGPGNVFST